MPDPSKPSWPVKPGWSGGVPQPSGNLTQPPDPNYADSEREYWGNEIRRLEQEYKRVQRLPASDQTQSMLEQLRQELKEARLNYARAGSGSASGQGGGGGAGGFNLSQSQGFDQGSGGMSPNDFMKWMDRFMARSAGWKSKYGNESEVPAAWSPDDASVPTSSIDPMAVIRSAKPRLEEEMNRSFGSAAQRLGNMGALMSSGYAKELGKGARKASSDLGELTMNTLFQAGENQAQREAAARQAALDRSLSAWGTHGGWQMDQGRQWESQWPQLLQMFAGMMPRPTWG